MKRREGEMFAFDLGGVNCVEHTHERNQQRVVFVVWFTLGYRDLPPCAVGVINFGCVYSESDRGRVQSSDKNKS